MSSLLKYIIDLYMKRRQCIELEKKYNIEKNRIEPAGMDSLGSIQNQTRRVQAKKVILKIWKFNSKINGTYKCSNKFD